MTTDILPALHRQRFQDAAATSPPIDTEVLFSRCMGNVSFALTLLGELERTGKRQVDAIVLHAASSEPQAAAEAAHSLKGAAGILGAEPLRGKATEIEAAGRSGDTSRLLEMAHDLRIEMDRCLVYIPTLRARTRKGADDGRTSH